MLYVHIRITFKFQTQTVEDLTIIYIVKIIKIITFKLHKSV